MMLPDNLLKYYETLKTNFLNTVENRDRRGVSSLYDGRRYYWRWMSTSGVATKLNVSSAVARYNLTRLEKLGFVNAWRECNCVRWSVKDVEGFEQFEYKDYLRRVV